MKINVSKSVDQNVLDLINATVVGLNLTAGQVTIAATPTVLDSDPDGKNSSLVITAVANQGYAGTKTIKYNRLGVDKGVVSVPAAITVLPSDDEAAKIAKVVAALGLIASEVTVTGADQTPADENDTSVSTTITPNVDSKLYVGAPLVVQLTVPDADVSLETAITTDVMDGFDPA